jgi:hypothetical protein
MIAGQPAPRYADEGWKYKRLYVGLRPGVSLHFYDTDGAYFNGINPKSGLSFDFAVQAAVQLHRYFSVQTELILTADSIAVSRNLDAFDEYNNFLYNYTTANVLSSRSLLIPVLAKGTLRPSVFSINGLAGLYFSIPLGQAGWTDSFYGTSASGDISTSVGFAAGGSFGIKIGSGLLFLDIRYMADFTKTKIELPEISADVYRRSMLAFGIGYKMGYIAIKEAKK